jgi:putative DNA primase/helicase
MRKLIASAPFEGEDTSTTAASVITDLQKRGYSDQEIIKLFEAYPRGIGKRYAQGKDLKADVDRLRNKYDDAKQQRDSVSTGKALLIKPGKAKAIRWLWKDHLARGGIEIMSGEPGLGKSQAQISLIATITTARIPWPNGDAAPPAPQNVIMITAEDTLDDIITPRLMAAGADKERVRILKCIQRKGKDEYFLLGEHILELEEAIRELGNVALVTIDPVTAVLGSSKQTDSHRVTDVRDKLRPLQDVADRTGVAISLVTHPSKSSGHRAMNQFIGSQAFIAAPRIGHVITKEMDKDDESGERMPTERMIFAVAKTNHRWPASLVYRIDVKDVDTDEETGELIEAPFVIWEGEVSLTADQAVAAASGVELSDAKRKQKDCENWLSVKLENGPVLAKEIEREAKALGFGRHALDKAKGSLCNSRFVQPPGEKPYWVWELPFIPKPNH